MKHFFKVEDKFEISGRGCVIVPAIPEGLDFRIRAKDQIELRTPDGHDTSGKPEIITVGLRKRRFVYDHPRL